MTTLLTTGNKYSEATKNYRNKSTNLIMGEKNKINEALHSITTKPTFVNFF
jgi:hypothetical protein